MAEDFVFRAVVEVDGALGDTGAQGPPWQPEYGVGNVLVDRGSGASIWATYSTTVGSTPLLRISASVLRDVPQAGLW